MFYSSSLLRCLVVFLVLLCGSSYAGDEDLRSFRSSPTGSQINGDTFRVTTTVSRGSMAVGDPELYVGAFFGASDRSEATTADYRKIRVVLVDGVETFQVRTHPGNVVVGPTWTQNSPFGPGSTDTNGLIMTSTIKMRSDSINGPTVKSLLVGSHEVKIIIGSGTPVVLTDVGAVGGVGSGPDSDCPPRDLKFLMSLGIDAGPHESYNLMVTLTIASAGESTSDYQVVAPMIMKGPLGLSLEHDVPNVPGAFSYSWKYNGTIIASGSYGCGDEVPLNRVVDQASVVADPLNDQDSDGDPDITDPDDDGDGVPDDKEPPPNTPPASPPSTPPPGANGGTGAPDGSAGTPILQPGKTNPLPPGLGAGSGNTIGDVNVLNIQDFAKAFKWAVEESGNGNGFFSSPGNGALPTAGLTGPSDDGEELSTAPIDDLVEAMGTMRTAKDDAASLALAMNTTMESHKPSLPSPVATVATWRVQLGSTNGALFGRDYFDVDLSPYSAAIGIFRQVVSWLLLVMAWFKFWNYFRALLTI